MNISNYQKNFPRIIFRQCATKTPKFSTSNILSSNASLSNISWYATLLTGLFLSYKIFEFCEEQLDEIKLPKGPFYHCTKERHLVEIFKYGAVRTSNDGEIEKDYSNPHFKDNFYAYVSTKPEFDTYGNHALVFNDQLMLRSDGTPRGHNILHEWTEFNEDLPVDERCFDKILMQSFAKTKNEREIERKNLEDKISKVAGRSIRVELD